MKRGMEFIRLLTEFFDSYLPDTKGVSENTIRSYKAALRIFFIFLEEEKGIPAGTRTEIPNWPGYAGLHRTSRRT